MDPLFHVNCHDLQKVNHVFVPVCTLLTFVFYSIKTGKEGVVLKVGLWF